ncbi:MAG: carnitine dehydratase [Gammaproteobacteria bacterium SG8_31]|jgi:alpha-methylacyl-CoA racemase|nr:MAG: carnitine dehydratase [Gammaproteobacteria bacterium SG8_31]
MGPLEGIRVLEVAGLGAAPYAGMMLSDMGAEVVRVERMPPPPAFPDVLARGRRSIALNLKHKAGVDTLLHLVEDADALIEGFRPGVAERLGFGPEPCLERNPRLVYGRMTGWGQEGPLAPRAGHDLNYIGLSGALMAIGPAGGKPVPPLNLIGDFGGGLLLCFGLVSALLERARSGRGQVVDAAMLDAASSFMGMFFGFRAMGMFEDAPGRSMLGGAAHFYDTYETSDGGFLAVAAIEPEFYSRLIELLGLDPEEFLPHGFRGLGGGTDPSAWPILKERLAGVFRGRTRDEWVKIFEGSDACVSPVLGLSEAAEHPHNKARGTFTEVDGIVQNAPAPRFSRSRPDLPRRATRPGSDTRKVLKEAGIDGDRIQALADGGVIPSET